MRRARRLLGFAVGAGLLAGNAAGQDPLHQLFLQNGDATQDHLGWSMSGVGDIDGDAYDDFVAGGNPMIPQLAALGPGYMRVFSGRTGLVLFAAQGDAVGDELGISVSGTGDVDGDGVPDVLAGASQRYISSLSGYARVFSGKTGDELWTHYGSPPGEWFGASVAGLGDLNGDGFGDVLVGIPRSDLGGLNSGAVRAYSGEWMASMSAGSSPATQEVLYEAYGPPGAFWGTPLAAAGLVDGDDVPDFVASAPGSTQGYVSVHSGRDGALLWSVSAPTALFGGAIAGVGDLDGDGRGDIAVGAEQDATQGLGVGSVSFFSGLDGSPLVTLYGTDPEFADPTFGLGSSVAGVGDVNGDGFPDVGVGARVAGDAVQGAFDLISGEWIASRAAGVAPVTNKVLLHLEGESAFDWFGFSAAGLGDVDGDGRTDFGVGAVRHDVPGAGDAGAVYVFSGSTLSLCTSSHAISLAAGGTQSLLLDAPAGMAGELYLILGSASGSKPGATLDGLPMPLNLDGYSTLVATLANQGPFQGFLGLLDAAGDGAASFALPPGLGASLAGVTLDHAFLVIELAPVPAVSFISNPVPVTFVP